MNNNFPILSKNYTLVRRYGKSFFYPFYGRNSIQHSSPEYEYNTINKSAAEILSFCDGTNSIWDISQHLAAQYNEGIEKTCQFVSDFIQDCLQHEFVTLSNTPIRTEIHICGDFDIVTPVHACVEITKRCPLKCLHCYNDSGAKKGYEMNHGEVISVLQTLHNLGVQKVMLTGGEPTVRDDFCDIVQYACENFVAVSVGSNGYLITDEIAVCLSKCKSNLVIQISIDGNEKHHNEIRGLNDSFERATNAIKLLRSRGIAVTVASTLNERNFFDMEEIAQCVHKLGALQLSFAITTNQGRARENGLSYGIDMDSLFERALNLKKLYLNKGMYVQVDDEVQTSKVTSSPNCGAGLSQIAVRENGDVAPCLCFFYTYGNLLKDNVKTIFHHDNVALFENMPRPNKTICGDCDAFENCQNCPARAFDSKLDTCKWKADFHKILKAHQSTKMQKESII